MVGEQFNSWTALNKRTNRLITVGDVEKTLKEWCQTYNIKYQIVTDRLRLGWNPTKALTHPINPRGRTCKLPFTTLAVGESVDIAAKNQRAVKSIKQSAARYKNRDNNRERKHTTKTNRLVAGGYIVTVTRLTCPTSDESSSPSAPTQVARRAS